ncbi:MAG: hypothetical protein HUJ72_12845, partial [Blautia sp.]|nr:hypothetical protein [Blautia sp.]
LTYKVTGTKIIHATECDILKIQPGQDMVTLFSCYPYLSIGTKYRLVIFCERTDITKQKMDVEEKDIGAESISIRDLIEQDLQEQGIVISDIEKEALSRQEDLIRKILPCICILFAILLIYLRRRPKKRTYSKQNKNQKGELQP